MVVAGHMTRGSCDRSWRRMRGDLVVSVEGRGSLVNVEGFLNLSQEPLLPHQDLGVIQCVVMTGGRGVYLITDPPILLQLLSRDPPVM